MEEKKSENKEINIDVLDPEKRIEEGRKSFDGPFNRHNNNNSEPEVIIETISTSPLPIENKCNDDSSSSVVSEEKGIEVPEDNNIETIKIIEEIKLQEDEVVELNAQEEIQIVPELDQPALYILSCSSISETELTFKQDLIVLISETTIINEGFFAKKYIVYEIKTLVLE